MKPELKTVYLPVSNGFLEIIDVVTKQKIEEVKKPISQLLIQYDKEMNVINEFESLMDAYKFTDISRAAIANNLSGLSKSAGGFIWKYKQLNN